MNFPLTKTNYAYSTRQILYQSVSQVLTHPTGAQVTVGQGILVCNMGVSENSVPLNPMVNDHYPY